MRVVYEGGWLCIRTRCRNVDELVGTMKRYVVGTSVFVATLSGRPVGTESPFVIALADAAVPMRGLCVIRDVWTDSQHAFGRPGMLIGLTALSRASMDVFRQMRGDHSAPSSIRFLPASWPDPTDAGADFASELPTEPVLKQIRHL